jgi:hypothetical protein
MIWLMPDHAVALIIGLCVLMHMLYDWPRH